MEIKEKIVRELRQSAQFQEELKKEIINLNGLLALENQNLSTIQREGSHLFAELTNLEEITKSLKDQENFLSNTRDAFSKSHLWRLYFKKFVTNMDPNSDQRNMAFEDIQARYAELVRCYEQKPEYKQILEAENINKELTEKIGEKRNELMKLETEREF